MKVIIAGSRDITDYDLVSGQIEILLKEHDITVTEVVSGRCRGVDAIGEKWAKSKGIPVILFPAQWFAHGKAAGPIRNAKMAEYADVLLAFPKGESRGTWDMAAKMSEREKKVYMMKSAFPYANGAGNA